jgi:hypothetical protein
MPPILLILKHYCFEKLDNEDLFVFVLFKGPVDPILSVVRTGSRRRIAIIKAMMRLKKTKPGIRSDVGETVFCLIHTVSTSISEFLDLRVVNISYSKACFYGK